MMIPNDIVQITDPDHAWYSCILIVSEVKSWGVLASVYRPTSNDNHNIITYLNRLEYRQIRKVGHSIIDMTATMYGLQAEPW